MRSERERICDSSSHDGGLSGHSGDVYEMEEPELGVQDTQLNYRCEWNSISFTFLTPARFADSEICWKGKRRNRMILAFSIDWRRWEAAKSVKTLEKQNRDVLGIQRVRAAMHPEVLKYCRLELMQDNYFHAVFEATKGLAQSRESGSRAVVLP